MRGGRLTGTGRLVVALPVVLWLAGFVVGGRPLYLTAYGLAAAIGAALFLPQRMPSPDASRRGVPARSRPGQTCDVTIEVRARGRVPAMLLEDRRPAALGGPARFVTPALSPGDHETVSAPLTVTRRGIHAVGPLMLTVTDRFGLVRRDVEVVQADEIVVHPPRLPGLDDPPRARRFDEPPRRPPTSRPWPSGYDLANLREYRPGDDLRHVSWHATARRGTLIVREAEQGATDLVTIVVDTGVDVHVAPRPMTGSPTFEAAAAVAAAVAEQALRSGFGIVLEDLGGPRAGPLRGLPAVTAALDACASLAPTDGQLATALERLRRIGRRLQHVTVVTPRVDHAAATAARLLLDRDTTVTVLDVSEAGDVVVPPGVALQRISPSVAVPA